MTKCAEACGGGWFSRMMRRPEIITRNNALLWGVAWLIISSMAGWYFRILPTSACGFIVSDYVPLVWHVALNVTVWITWALPVYVLLVAAYGRVNMVEVFGRLLFAHWPVTLVMLLPILGDRVLFATFAEDMTLSFRLDALSSVIYAVIMAMVVIWWWYWSYVALRKASRGVTDHVGWIYVAGMILGMVLSRTALSYMIAWLS